MKYKGKDISDFDKKIISLLDTKIMSISQLSKELKQNRQLTKGFLESLRYRDLVKRTTVGKAEVYQVK